MPENWLISGHEFYTGFGYVQDDLTTKIISNENVQQFIVFISRYI